MKTILDKIKTITWTAFLPHRGRYSRV